MRDICKECAEVRVAIFLELYSGTGEDESAGQSFEENPGGGPSW